MSSKAGRHRSGFVSVLGAVQRPAWTPWTALASAAGAMWLLTWALGRVPAAVGEPWTVRWLRALVEHPYRSVLGLAALALGLGPRPTATPDRDPGENPDDRGNSGPSHARIGAYAIRADRSPTPPADAAGPAKPGSSLGIGPRRPLPPLSMASTVLVDIVRGPEELAGFGKSLLLEPVQPTTRPDRYPTQAVVVTHSARRMIELSKGGERLESIVVHGTLDPTLHPEFVEVSENLRELCNKWYPKAKLCLLAEAPQLSDPLVRHALIAYDTVVLRFETATQKTYKALTGRDGGEIKALVEAMGKIDHRNLIVRTRFVRGSVDNSTENEVRGWLKLLAAVKPATVQIETPGKNDHGLKAITKTRMGQIVDQITEKVGAEVEQL